MTDAADRRDDCAFCRIADGRTSVEFLYEDDDVVAFADINPQAPVHVLVIPRRHVADFHGLAATDDAYAGRVIQGVSRAAQAVTAPSGHRIVANLGPDAGQSIFHLHFHVLTGRRLGWPPG